MFKLKHSKLQAVAILGFLFVAFGAFGAHALKTHLDSESLEIFKTASFYHAIHTVALFLTSLLADQIFLRRAFLCFFFGVLIFSGSLYLLAITGVKILGAITPIGGVLFLIGWIFLFLGSKKV